MFTAHVRPEPVTRPTIEEAVTIMLRAEKADPEVTYMPYVKHADGTPLTVDEADEQDRIEMAIDYEALSPWTGAK